MAEDDKLKLQQMEYEQEKERERKKAMAQEVLGGMSEKARSLVQHAAFEQLVLICILLSSVVLAVEGPPNAYYLEGRPTLVQVMFVLDTIFFVVFWVEAVGKITWLGFAAYLSDAWNRLDFFIVIMTSVDFVVYHLALGDDFSWTAIFRTFRVLRPLRVVQHHENVRVVLDSLIQSAGTVSATIALATFIFLVFGILR